MTWLSGAVTTIAWCWRVERRDGVAIGMTAHDRDLVVDGLVHRATPGMLPSAIRRGVALEADTMEVTAALASEAVSEADLIAGRWDGARVVVFALDWSGGAGSDRGRVDLGEGVIGAVSMRDGAFTAELMGVGAALERPVVETTAPACRATLGDARCRVAMAGRRRFARVVSAQEAVVTLDAAEPVADAYGGGTLRWFGGNNAGLIDAIAVSAGTSVTLEEAPRFGVEPGVLVELIEGCDKRLATCAQRFGNAVNFRGEPFLPGIDLLTRYPGA